MGIISMTGCDGVGKSTLVKVTSKSLNCEWKHFDKPKDLKDGKQQYFNFAEMMNSNPSEVIVADRLHEGEWIYAPLYRGYKADYMREFEREIVKVHNFLLVYVKAEVETIIERTRIRGEDFVKEEHFQTVLDLFNDYMNQQSLPFIEIDTTNSETENDLKRILLAYEKINTIWNLIRNGQATGAIMTPALPRGNIEADVMLIGQNPGGKGKPGIHYSTTWCDVGALSDFVLNITKEAGIHRKTWYTNLVPYPTADNKVTNQQIEDTIHIIGKEIELIQPKKIITLGNIASTEISKRFGKDFEVIELLHPAYVKRFFSGHPDKMKNYKEAFKVL